jgi:hypothetical protein
MMLRALRGAVPPRVLLTHREVGFRPETASTPRRVRNEWVVSRETGPIESHQWRPTLPAPASRELAHALLACNVGY